MYLELKELTRPMCIEFYRNSKLQIVKNELDFLINFLNIRQKLPNTLMPALGEMKWK